MQGRVYFVREYEMPKVKYYPFILRDNPFLGVKHDKGK
jgi:hypothetical protein